jgi:hypothetical protein
MGGWLVRFFPKNSVPSNKTATRIYIALFFLEINHNEDSLRKGRHELRQIKCIMQYARTGGLPLLTLYYQVITWTGLTWTSLIFVSTQQTR